MEPTDNRRGFIRKFATIGAALGFGSTLPAAGPVAADEHEEVETIRLLGYVSNWEGVEPDDIEEVPNPTLALEEGKQYRVIWENGDGVAHNFVIYDNTNHTFLATDLMSEQGETQEVEFPAEAVLDGGTYFCDPHASQMRGDIVVGTTSPADLSFAVTAPEEVDEGASVTIEFEATNAGDESGTTAVSATFGDENSTAELTIGGGNTETETFNFATDGRAGDEVEWFVEADGDEIDAGVTSVVEGDSDQIEDWDEVEEIRLEGEIDYWTGVSPPMIDGVENPTFELSEGQSYTVIWENLDGFEHNFALRDADGENLMASDLMGEEGETQEVTFDADSEMVEYVCEPHSSSMNGDIEFPAIDDEPPDDGDDGDDSDPSDDGDDTDSSDDGDDGDAGDDENDGGDGDDDDGLPGFGPIAAIIGLGAGAAAAARRFANADSEE